MDDRVRCMEIKLKDKKRESRAEKAKMQDSDSECTTVTYNNLKEMSSLL